jgi:ubiquinone biosynthesis accessory factor UbiJ
MNWPPFPLPTPPAWLQTELQARLVLLLNHVLMQEPAAMARLQRQAGKRMQVVGGPLVLWLQATPAGLLSLCAPLDSPDLRLTVQADSPWTVAQSLLAGQRPPVDIQGDVQLAAEVAWLVDNVRWDLEEDLSRLFGDAVAHTLVDLSRQGASALRALLAQARAGRPGAAP